MLVQEQGMKLPFRFPRQKQRNLSQHQVHRNKLTGTETVHVVGYLESTSQHFGNDKEEFQDILSSS
jgi:hypothetical protein